MDVTSLLADLVRLPSINPMGRALPEELIFESRVTQYMETFFKNVGARTERTKIQPGRDNLVAFMDPPGNPSQTILFEAHQDTVPVDGMIIDPFGAKIEAGKLYGRGACDVKGGLASMATAFARLFKQKKAGMPQLIMACTIDEEHGFQGSQSIVNQPWLKAKDPKSIWAVVAEPTRLHIVNAHKGAVRWDLQCKGVSCHSSTPEKGKNAIYNMAKLLPYVEEYAKHLAGLPGHPRLGSATLSCGTIRGGASVNTVPDFCAVQVDRRLLPGETPEGAVNQFREWLGQKCKDIPFEVTEPWLAAPALGDEYSPKLVQALGNSIRSRIGTLEIDAEPYGTDAASLCEAFIPAVVFGPGSIAQAHTKDEWIEIEQLKIAEEILCDFVLSQCS